jgi:hypothetical protein
MLRPCGPGEAWSKPHRARCPSAGNRIATVVPGYLYRSSVPARPPAVRFSDIQPAQRESRLPHAGHDTAASTFLKGTRTRLCRSLA